jgi:GH24 family phage-related lysozyme (muramidase)
LGVNTFQDRVLARAKAEGLIPMSTGVTQPVPIPTTYSDVFENVTRTMDRAQSAYGTSTLDRYSNDVGSSYRDKRYSTVAGFEGVRTRSYPDNGGRSIGVGFNMDRPGARQVWNQVIGKTVSFDDAKAGKTQITTAQAKALFDHDILDTERLVDKAAGGRNFTQNQRIALVSWAYNAPSRVLAESDTLRSGSPAEIMDVILHRSFNPNNPYADALKKRRYVEASLFGNPTEAKDVMPSFAAYDASVHVDTKTGHTTIKSVGTGDVEHLNSEFRGRLQNLFDAAPANIRDGLGVYSGYRSVTHQAKLWNDALKKYGSPSEARKWVAPPGPIQPQFRACGRPLISRGQHPHRP